MNEKFVKMGLKVIPIITFFGIKYVYRLSDMDYGGFLIHFKGEPKYYFNFFDPDYDSILKKLESKGGNKFLEARFNDKNGLSVHDKYWGFILYAKETIKIFNIEKLPIELLK
jgi:hypothetical protein